MPYASIKELPKNVRGVLPQKAQEIYLAAFNNALEHYKDEDTARKVAWNAVKNKYQKNSAGEWVRRMGDMEYFVPFSADDGWRLYFPVGTVYHRGQKIVFTPKDAEEMVQNFKKRIPDYDLPINILHTDAHGVYGYIADMRATDRGVEWLPQYRDEKKGEIKDKGYKYASPELQFRSYQSVDGGKHNNVALGIALTPRPRLGQMTAVFSEDADQWMFALDGAESENALPLYQIDGIVSALTRLRDIALRYEKEEVGQLARNALEALKPLALWLIAAMDDDAGDMEEFAQSYKTEGGKKYARKAYLIVPDSEKPTTWKCRIEETPGNITIAQLGRAAAALRSFGGSKTYRGEHLQGVTADQVAAAKKRLIALYRGEGVDKEKIPAYLFGEDIMEEFDIQSLAEGLADKLGAIFRKKPDEQVQQEGGDMEEMERLKAQFGELQSQLEEKNSAVEQLSQQLTDERERATQASERLAEVEHAKKLIEFTEQVGQLPVLPVSAEEFAPVLMKFAEADAEAYEALWGVLQALSNAAKSAGIFSEHGTDGTGTDAASKLEIAVRARMQEASESYAIAMENVIGEHPELYAEYDKATVKVLSTPGPVEGE